jgi:hypothetical protein
MANLMDITTVVFIHITLAMVITIRVRVPSIRMKILVDAIFIAIAIFKQKGYDIFSILNISTTTGDRPF